MVLKITVVTILVISVFIMLISSFFYDRSRYDSTWNFKKLTTLDKVIELTKVISILSVLTFVIIMFLY